MHGIVIHSILLVNDLMALMDLIKNVAIQYANLR